LGCAKTDVYDIVLERDDGNVKIKPYRALAIISGVLRRLSTHVEDGQRWSEQILNKNGGKCWHAATTVRDDDAGVRAKTRSFLAAVEARVGKNAI
jgi:hypothetical protein